MDFAFHVCNSLSSVGMATGLNRFLGDLDAPPVIVCIGSDLTIGDSLGPVVGTMLQKRITNSGVYLYGTLTTPVTAKEIKYLNTFLRQTHPKSKIIAIDAALGDESEIGLIKIFDTALRPGSGANKRLGKVGDVSILGILAKKTAFPYSQLNLTRLNTVYLMADAITNGLCNYLEQIESKKAGLAS